MANRRELLHKRLCDILQCSTMGLKCRCYFQPPESVKMNYPAIVYGLDDIESIYADNGVYSSKRKYSVTLIDRNPDSVYIEQLFNFPLCEFDRSYQKDNLNHYVFNLFF